MLFIWCNSSTDWHVQRPSMWIAVESWGCFPMEGRRVPGPPVGCIRHLRSVKIVWLDRFKENVHGEKWVSYSISFHCMFKDPALVPIKVSIQISLGLWTANNEMEEIIKRRQWASGWCWFLWFVVYLNN